MLIVQSHIVSVKASETKKVINLQNLMFVIDRNELDVNFHFLSLRSSLASLLLCVSAVCVCVCECFFGSCAKFGWFPIFHFPFSPLCFEREYVVSIANEKRVVGMGSSD